MEMGESGVCTENGKTLHLWRHFGKAPPEARLLR
jgi:hypothetical protein